MSTARLMTSNWSRVHQFTAIDDTYRTVESDPVVATLNSYIFRAVDVPYLADITNRFEYYRIERIDVKYQPFVTQVVAFNGEAPGADFILPNVASTFVPYSSTFSTFNSIIQRGDARVATATTAWKQTIRPVPLMRAFDTALADGFINLGPQWITRDRPDVPHYGYWIAIEPTVAGASPTFGGRITFHYTISFKNPVGLP